MDQTHPKLPDTGLVAGALAVGGALGHMLTQRIQFLPVLCIGSIEVCPLMQSHVADMLPFNWRPPTLQNLMCYTSDTCAKQLCDVLSVIKAIIPPQIFYGDVQLEVDSSLLTTQSLELVFLHNNSIHQKLVTPRFMLQTGNLCT